MATVSARPASAFHSSDFARFYAGQSLSYLGDGLRTLAIPLLVFRLTGSGQALGWTWGLELLPYAVVSLVAGSLADRVDRRRLMLACDALRFTVMALFTLLFATGHLALWMIYAGVLLLAVGGATFLGAQTPSIPFLLGRQSTQGAVAALQATEQSVNLVAPPIGGALMGVLGPLPALAANAVTYLLSLGAIASVRTFGPETPGAIPRPREIASDIADGWRLLMADRSMRITSLCSLCFNFIGSVGFVALIPFFKHAFGATDAAVGVAFGCFAAGGATGSFIAGRTHWPVGRALIVANLCDSVLWLLPAWMPTMPLAVVTLALASISGAYYVTTIVTWRLRVTPHDAVGRVFGVARLLALIGMLPGALAGGWIADHLGARIAIAISAIGYLLISLVLATSAIRHERR